MLHHRLAINASLFLGDHVEHFMHALAHQDFASAAFALATATLHHIAH